MEPFKVFNGMQITRKLANTSLLHFLEGTKTTKSIKFSPTKMIYSLYLSFYVRMVD